MPRSTPDNFPMDARESAKPGAHEPNGLGETASARDTSSSGGTTSSRIRPRRVDETALLTEAKASTEATAFADAKPFHRDAHGPSWSATSIQDTNFIHWQWDLTEDRFSHVSREALSLGYPLRHWYQPGFFASIIHPGDRDAVITRRAKYLDAWLPYRSQYRVLDAKQNVVWFDDIVFVEADVNNQLSVRGIFIDVTERKRAIDEVRRSESLHRSLFECLGNGFVVQDLNDVIIQCNSAAAKILGVQPGELIGRSSRDPNWKGQLPDGTWIDASQHPSMTTLRTGEAQRDVTFSVQRADGERIWLRVNTQPVLDDDGVMQAVMVEFADITSEIVTRRSLDAAKQQALLRREQLEVALDAANIGVWTWQPTTNTFACDERCQAILNLPERTALTLQDWLQQVHVDDRTRLESMLAQMQQGSTRKLECIYRIGDDNQRQRWVQTTGRVPNDDVTPLGIPVSGVVQDVTAAKTRELDLARLRDEANQANHTKSVFLANVSHEIRTPLTAILGYTEMLRQDRDLWNDLQETDRALETVENAGNHLLTVINDILDLTKIEAGHSTIEIDAINPLQILLEVESLLRPRAEGKGVRYDTRLESSIPPLIYTDGTRLKQVILNLVGNAVKFTAAGFVQVRVRQVGNDPSIRLQIDVIDSGPGIEADDQERVFASFVQADTSMNRQYGGTGLGLTISRRLIEAMGGNVFLVDSQSGIGSTFRIELPVQTAAGSAFREAQASSGSPIATMNETAASDPNVAVFANAEEGRDDLLPSLSGRILVVDDGPDNLRLITYMLHRAGAEVASAASAETALEMFAAAIHRDETAFDLVITDIQMPGMNGLQLAQRIRAITPHVPIFALTAHAMRDSEQSCLSAGCNEFIPKPIDRAALVASCHRWLRQRVKTE